MAANSDFDFLLVDIIDLRRSAAFLDNLHLRSHSENGYPGGACLGYYLSKKANYAEHTPLELHVI